HRHRARPPLAAHPRRPALPGRAAAPGRGVGDLRRLRPVRLRRGHLAARGRRRRCAVGPEGRRRRRLGFGGPARRRRAERDAARRRDGVDPARRGPRRHRRGDRPLARPRVPADHRTEPQLLVLTRSPSSHLRAEFAPGRRVRTVGGAKSAAGCELGDGVGRRGRPDRAVVHSTCWALARRWVTSRHIDEGGSRGVGRSGRVLAAVAVCAAVALSGCDGGGEDPTADTTTAEPTTEEPTSEEPTSEAPEPPEVESPTPAPETETDDHVGAIWAARYFLDLYTYMRATGDTAS